MKSTLDTVMIYARNMQKTADFYRKYFGFESRIAVQGLIHLVSPDGGGGIAVHQAAKTVKLGQVGMKIIFSVADVDAFKERSAKLGLVFGATHRGEGYAFANAKDPDKNSVGISSYRFKLS